MVLSRLSPSHYPVIALSVVMLASCSSTEPSHPDVAAVSVSPKTARIWIVGDSARFSAAITTPTGTDGTGIPIKWTSRDPQLVSVTESGVAHTLKKGGSTYVVATAEGVSDSALVEAPLTPCGSVAPVTLAVGQVVTDIGVNGFCAAEDPDARYSVIASYSSLVASASASIELIGQGLANVEVTPRPSLANRPGFASSVYAFRRPIRRDSRGEAASLVAQKALLSPLFADAQRWYGSRRAGATRSVVVPSVGDIKTVNVSMGASCLKTSRVDHQARVAAVSRNAIVLSDQANPSGGFTDAEYANYATMFDTLVNPLDTATFGAPTDIDNNGRVVILFTRAINEMTANGADTYTGGRTMPRDLFPTTSDGIHTGCDASNVSEIFYMLVPDPNGEVNGNKEFTKGFVDSQTVVTIAHEYQHMINISRRMYLLPNQTSSTWVDEVWLHEGLSHMAEELLFHRMSGMPTRVNIALSDILASNEATLAFNLDMLGDFFNYDSYAFASTQSSPYQANDDVTTRGATWSFLRYAADRLGPTDGDLFRRLVNTNLTGLTNLETQLGVTPSAFTSMVRDFNVAVYADDFVPVDPRFSQLSWNLRSIYPGFNDPTFTFPIDARPLTDNSPVAAALVAGGFAVYEFAAQPGTAAFVRATGTAGSTMPAGITLSVVRTE
jgi:hypothetical protein